LVSPDALAHVRAQTKERCVMGLRFQTCAVAFTGLMLLAPAVKAQDQSQSNAVVLPSIVVSATTVPTPAAEVASSVTVITAADIAREQRRTVADLLMTVPGLDVVQNGSPGTQTSIFIRGTNSNQVKVLVDGIDMSDPSNPTGGFDFGHLLTSDIERIEVLRGPQSGLYGADAIGGVIDITTKKGSGPAKVTGMVEGGSFGSFNQAVGVTGSQGRFNYAFNVSHYSYTDLPVTPGYMVPPGSHAMGNAYDNKTISTRLGAEVTDNLAFNFIGRYTNAKLNYSDDDPSTFPGVTFSQQSTYKNQDFHGRVEAVTKSLDGRLVNTFGVNYSEYWRNNQDPAPNPPTSFDGSREKFDWRGKLLLTPGETLVAGLERENDRATSDNLNGKTGNQAGYVELQSEVAKRFFLASNVRYDDNDSFGGHATWRLAPSFIVPGTETKLKASYGTGFKPPQLYQLYGVGPYGFVGNPNLLPETSSGYDFGFEQPLGRRVRVGLTYFHNDITNLIDYNTSYTSLVNIGKAKTYGVEAFASFEITGNLRTRFDYTHTIAKDEITGMDLLRRPRDKYSASAVWRPTDRLTITPTLLYLGTWLDIDRSTFVYRDGGDVAVVNLAADYVLNEHVTLFGRVDNLFNKQYEDPLGWLQPGLAVYGGVKLATN
jgi:vitamin B12 transporter